MEHISSMFLLCAHCRSDSLIGWDEENGASIEAELEVLDHKSKERAQPPDMN
ncbi:MAG TPA: hypothetical protein P5114_01610 [Hyphomicrobiaceae bacterium]|nr:hypothetical protein [Hyphomicrobiaceae bacterium]